MAKFVALVPSFQEGPGFGRQCGRPVLTVCQLFSFLSGLPLGSPVSSFNKVHYTLN